MLYIYKVKNASKTVVILLKMIRDQLYLDSQVKMRARAYIIVDDEKGKSLWIITWLTSA